jgi:hypothetical protein
MDFYKSYAIGSVFLLATLGSASTQGETVLQDDYARPASGFRGAAKRSSPGAIGTTVEERLIKAVKALDMDTVNEMEARNAFIEAMKNSKWKMKSFFFDRFKIDRGLTASIRMEVDTGTSCIRNSRWMEFLGRPWSLNLADPLGFVDISTPEEVDRYLNGRVVAIHYRLNENYAYSIYSDESKGCFNYFRVD